MLDYDSNPGDFQDEPEKPQPRQKPDARLHRLVPNITRRYWRRDKSISTRGRRDPEGCKADLVDKRHRCDDQCLAEEIADLAADSDEPVSSVDPTPEDHRTYKYYQRRRQRAARRERQLDESISLIEQRTEEIVRPLLPAIEERIKDLRLLRDNGLISDEKHLELIDLEARLMQVPAVSHSLVG